MQRARKDASRGKGGLEGCDTCIHSSLTPNSRICCSSCMSDRAELSVASSFSSRMLPEARYAVTSLAASTASVRRSTACMTHSSRVSRANAGFQYLCVHCSLRNG